MKRFAIWMLFGLAGACTNQPAGLSYTSVTLSATNSQGETTQGECTTLPILLGSRSLNDIDFDGRFRARIFASAQDVEITFSGVQSASSLRRDVSAEELEGGYSETLDVVASNGEAYEVLINSGCAE